MSGPASGLVPFVIATGERLDTSGAGPSAESEIVWREPSPPPCGLCGNPRTRWSFERPHKRRWSCPCYALPAVEA